MSPCDHNAFADVAVIIPAKDSAHSIARALQSVVAQTLPVREIIVVDDDSTDDTAAIAGGVVGVKVLRVNFSNRAMARNAGVAASSSTLIAFLDSDDEWSPGKIAAETTFFHQQKLDLAFHDFSLVYPDAPSVASWARACRGDAWYADRQQQARACELSDIVGQGDYLFTSTALISRELWNSVGGMRREFLRCQDVDLWLRCHEAGANIGYLPEVLATKHGHRQITGATTFWYRLRLLDQAVMRLSTQPDRAPERAQLVDAFLRNQRSFAGWARRNGNWTLALFLYAAGYASHWRYRLAMRAARSVQPLTKRQS